MPPFGGSRKTPATMAAYVPRCSIWPPGAAGSRASRARSARQARPGWESSSFRWPGCRGPIGTSAAPIGCQE